MTTKTYIGTKIIQARPMMGPAGNMYPDQDGYEVVYPDGYTSWSPKAAFEQAYRLTDRMTFGDALVMLKAGKKVARADWPPGCFLVMQDGAIRYQLDEREFSVAHDVHIEEHDMLAEDWQVVE